MPPITSLSLWSRTVIPDLEEMIRQRAHEIWEQEGRPHGRHEEHWQRAAGEITQELERIKSAHTPATAEEIEAPDAPRRGRPRRSQSTEGTTTPAARRSSKAAPVDSVPAAESAAGAGEAPQDGGRKRGRKAAGEKQSEGTPAERAENRRRVARGTTGAQSEPATEAAPTARRRRGQAAVAGPDAGTPERPTRRGRKPKGESEVSQ
jgi:hypothetical protein